MANPDVYNRVYWYRVIAVDSDGNQSPMSAPIRGVLYDRSQPEPDARLYDQSCSYSITAEGDCEIAPEDDDVFILKDMSGEAESYKFFQQCGAGAQLLTGGPLTEGTARIKFDSLPDDGKCSVYPCADSQGLFVRFYDARGKILGASEPSPVGNICTFNGCLILEKTCRWKRIGNPYFPYYVPNEKVRLCVPLKTGQSARIYYQTPDGMSPFYTFAKAADSDIFCHDLDDLSGVTPDDTCIGIRIFSPNHVGSRMFYAGCMEMHARDNQPPPRPFLDPPEALEEQIGRFFRLSWSMPMEGIGSYILRIREEGGGSSYKSLWDVRPDDTGRYQSAFHLSPENQARRICFQVRALSTDMQASAWSDEQCGTWHSAPPENLPWPPVAEPVDAGPIGAFFMSTEDDHQPVLVLSENLTSELDRLMQCINKVTICNQKTLGTPCMRNTEFEFVECPACSIIRSKMPVGDFMVYRQESGHDFVQISPLVEGFHCRTEEQDDEVMDILDDPFITLLDVDRYAVTGVSDPAGIGGGIRILFKDRYPYRVHSRIRYKLMGINHDTGEPEKIFTSNWVDIP